VFGSLGMAWYRFSLAGALPAEASPRAAADALATLGGATTAAASLSAASGATLLAAARAAFVDALQLTAAVGAAIVVIACLVTARILRGGAGSSGAAEPRST
jgi:DHA2 family multidrug resistance protein-like MFS transporter